MAATFFSATLGMDVSTLLVVLVWGNIVSILLAAWFRLSLPAFKNRAFTTRFVMARAIQAAAYLLLLSRGALSDTLSINLGNSFLFIGFFFESLCLLTSIGKDTWGNICRIGAVALFSLFVFNLTETFDSGTGSFRIAMSSSCIFLLLLFPTVAMFFSGKKSMVRQSVAALYLMFLVLLLSRAVHAFGVSPDLLDNTRFQSLSFLSMVLLLLFSPAAYLLLMREKTSIRLRTMAMTDALTGLVNRHNFITHAEQVFVGSKAKKSPLAVLFIDIDDFKKINDTYGHAFGDTVLIRLARLLKDNLRTVDILCRYGGEEFVILLPRTDTTTAESVSSRIISQVNELRFAENPGFRFSLSIGLAALPPYGDQTLTDCIEQADCAMYEAKRTGKNKVITYRRHLPSGTGTGTGTGRRSGAKDRRPLPIKN